MAALCAIAPLAACSLLFPRWTYRYRIIVEIERGSKLYSGSSVIEVQREKGINGIGARIKGEAVTVDLGNGQTLFALLRGDEGGEAWPYWTPHKAFADRLGTAAMVDSGALTRLTRLVGETAILSVDQYPQLVRFRDIRDPMTVQLVNPKDLVASFGPGIKLRNISIQITDDPVTTGIDQKLTWLTRLRGGYLHGGLTASGSPLGLYGGYFSMGVLP